MKKLWFPVLLMALFLTSCAAVPKTPISLTSVKPAELEGTWEGQRTMPFDRFVFKDIVVLEIQPAGPPFKGKMTIYSSPRWDPGQTIKIYSFDRGQISGDGNLVLPMEQEISVNLRLFQEEKTSSWKGSSFTRPTKGSFPSGRSKMPNAGEPPGPGQADLFRGFCRKLPPLAGSHSEGDWASLKWVG